MDQALVQHTGQALVNSYGPSIKMPVWAKHYYTHMGQALVQLYGQTINTPVCVKH